MPRKQGATYPGDGGYDRGIRPEFGRLASRYREDQGLSLEDLYRGLSVELDRMGSNLKASSQSIKAALAGRATVIWLQVPMVEAWARVFKITDPVKKAELYAAAGHQPQDTTLEAYARVFEADFPVAV